MRRDLTRLSSYWIALLGLGALWAAIAQGQPIATPKVDPLACPVGTISTTEKILHVTDGYAACRIDPTDPQHAIITVAYSSHNDSTVEEDDFDYAVDIAIVDIASEHILSHRHTTNDFEWTGDFVDIKADTARYDLAPGLRAFGIRVKQQEGCARWCKITTTQLVLYVQRGNKLQKLMHTWVGEHEDGGGPDGKGYAAHRSVTVLCMGGQQSQRLTNIWSAERRVDSDNPDEVIDIDAASVPCGPTAPSRRLWRYNGKQYVAGKFVP